MSELVLALEPPHIGQRDAAPSDLFARPSRLEDIDLNSGVEQYTDSASQKPLAERLLRVWHERGDYSKLTRASILESKDEEAVEESDDTAPTQDELSAFNVKVWQQIETARSELTTALDLLSIISPPTDPPSVDAESLPLTQETLGLTATRPLPPLDAVNDPLKNLPLAISLDAIRSSANTLLASSECLFAKGERKSEAAPRKRSKRNHPDTWPSLLELNRSAAYTLVPIGARNGASLTGKNAEIAAREVGIFYGCAEAKDRYRRQAVTSANNLFAADVTSPQKPNRILSAQVTLNGVAETPAEWLLESEDPLPGRGKAIFAEELFTMLTGEARSENALAAVYESGPLREGETVSIGGQGWSLLVRLRNKSSRTQSSDEASGLLSSFTLVILRLLLLDIFAKRRKVLSTATDKKDRPLLGTVATFLTYAHRRRTLSLLLKRLEETIEGLETELDDGLSDEAGLAKAVLGITGDKLELGGSATIRLRNHVFHISYQTPFPMPPPPPHTTAPLPLPTLTLQAPGSPPFPVTGLAHAEAFLLEQLKSIRKQGRRVN